MNHTGNENDRERMTDNHNERAEHGKRHRGKEQRAVLETTVKIRRQRHGGRDHQQVDGGDPLHGCGVDVEFPHELREKHRHHGFGENADEGEGADRHDGSNELAGNAFVRHFPDVFTTVSTDMAGGFERCIPFLHNHFPRTFSCGHVRRRD